MMIIHSSDGSVDTIGSNGGDNYAQIELAHDERMAGDLILCGNGIGTRTGYMSFTTNKGQKFEAGTKHTL